MQISVFYEDKTSGILVQEKKTNLIFAVNLYIMYMFMLLAFFKTNSFKLPIKHVVFLSQMNLSSHIRRHISHP